MTVRYLRSFEKNGQLNHPPPALQIDPNASVLYPHYTSASATSAASNVANAALAANAAAVNAAAAAANATTNVAAIAADAQKQQHQMIMDVSKDFNSR